MAGLLQVRVQRDPLVWQRVLRQIDAHLVEVIAGRQAAVVVQGQGGGAEGVSYCGLHGRVQRKLSHYRGGLGLQREFKRRGSTRGASCSGGMDGSKQNTKGAVVA